jgi:signal transduction histidine kinase
MLFWLSILTGGFFIWLALKIGFYEILVLFFNLIISIYISIFLTPVISTVFPSSKDTIFYYTFSLSILSVGTFLILYGIAYTFLTGQFKVNFPKLFEILFAGILGFLTGFLVFSFAALVITVTPVSHNRFINQIGFNKQSLNVNISYICLWCDAVHKLVSSKDEKVTCENIIDDLLKNAKPKEESKQSRTNKVPTTPEPNNYINTISDNNLPLSP